MTPRALQYADGVEWDSDFVLDCHIRHPDALASPGAAKGDLLHLGRALFDLCAVGGEEAADRQEKRPTGEFLQRSALVRIVRPPIRRLQTHEFE